MHPRLKPGRTPVLRTPDTVQLGQGHARPVHLPADATTRTVLAHLDGRRSRAALLDHLRDAHGVDPTHGRDTLALLLAAGCLDDARTPTHALDQLPLDERRRRLLDIQAWNAAQPEPSIGEQRFARRHGAWVELDGDGPLVVAIAALLLEAGVGRVSVREWRGEPIGTADVGLLGPTPDEIGLGTVAACRAAAVRSSAAATRRCPAPPQDGPPSLIVLIGAVAAERAAEAVRCGLVHLHVDDEHGHGLVGPLVVPGASACGNCRHEHRTDADPTFRWAGRPPSVGLDALTRTSVAVLAAAQTLQHLDGRRRPATVDAVLRVPPDGGLPKREVIEAHPRCGCSWEVAPAA